MSFAATTLSAAVGANDTTILVASLTGVSAGMLVKIEGEFMKVLSVPSAATLPVPVLRGQEGTAQVAHPITIRAVFGLTPTAAGADWTMPVPGISNLAGAGSAVRARKTAEYGVAGAITLPDIGSDMMAFINGTGALAMTVAAPSTAQDGDTLTIVGNGKAAHTVTFTGGLGAVGATADVVTFAAGQQMAVEVVAAGGVWVHKSLVAGAATIAGGGIA